MENPDEGAPRWFAVTAVALFLIYALNFFYFFVDDEAIPYVYAQNILHGKGLSYNNIEGPLEGYSDFLHVWLATLILAVRNVAGLPKIGVFFVGKALSLVCGGATVLLAWHIMRRTAVPRAGAAAGLAILALAGPLAVWSCSSLETAPFALVFTMLVAALILESDAAAAVTAGFLILDRIDGFIYAAILIGAFVAVADGPRRRHILRAVALPAFFVLVAYHAWRVLYFGNSLPAPLEAKILYKLIPHTTLMVKAPDNSYLSGFVGVYGWLSAAAFVAATIHALWLGGVARALSIAAVPLVLYVSVVGDWMFGFRFFVAVLPIFSLVLAMSVGALSATRPRAASALSLIWVIAAGTAAHRFIEVYTRTVSVPSFLRAPSRDLHLFFRPYYTFYETVRTMIPHHQTVAYNQAGFIPFMLDLNNIDDLGICSGFYAALPSTDIYFTEVGRYAPLTNKPRLRVGQAYLVYRNAQFIMSGTDMLSRANGSAVPSGLFGGYYELAGTDVNGDLAIYRRTDKPAAAFATDPGTFVENVAHISYLRHASIGGVTIDPRAYARRLPFLHDEAANLDLTGGFLMSLQFAAHDESVRAISIEEVRASEPAVLNVTLAAVGGRVVHTYTVPMEPGQPRAVHIELAAGTRATRLLVELSPGHGVAARGRISDLRVEGQTPALEDYITRHLQFPAQAAAGHVAAAPARR